MEIQDLHRSGSPPIDDIDDNIVFLLRAFPFHIVCTLADSLSLSQSAILSHLREFLSRKLDDCCGMPHELTCPLKTKRIIMRGELLELLQMQEIFGFARE
jgi:hypothetical protein